MSLEKLTQCSRIVSFGCSVIYGDEMADCDIENYSHSTFPGVLASTLNKKYHSYAASGSGNDYIFSQLLHYIHNDRMPGDFVILGWSSCYRKCLYVPDFGDIRFVPSYSHYQDKNLAADIRRKIKAVDNYYRDIISEIDEIRLVVEFAIQIKTARDLLQFYEIPYVMVKALYDSKVISKNIRYQFNTDSNFWLDIGGKMEVDDIMSYVITHHSDHLHPNKHPNEQAHQILATLFMERLVND